MSNNNTNTKKTTFWKFLTDNTTEIPIIQRDYAQGREGKEHLRKNFLSDLKVALDKGEELKLDFVYGSKENNKLNPLDGQQRLTTLWLLHWYIAFRSGRLTDANTTLNKFTYETRISSREFCKELCKTENFKKYCFGNIVEYIKNQTWFYSAWKQDPTIQSMLRMLGGTTNKAGEPNNDGIEQVFNCSGCEITNNEKQCKYEKYWNLLAESDESPIIFYYLPLNEFKLTDDLYIKMNARGEQLTSFENFKADLIGYITKQKDNDELPKEAKEEWGKLLDEKEGIPIKLDTTWTEFFWKNKSQDYTIDEIYFAFLNRFFLNWRISMISDDKDAGYKYFTGDEKGENEIVYKTINDYYFDDKIEIDFFAQLKTILNNYHDSKIDESSDILRHDKTWNEKFYFIPKYYEEKATEIECKGKLVNKIYTVNQKERVAFYAICKYFNANPVERIDNKFDYTSLKRWMRVVWNIISVQTADGRDAIRNVAEMKNAIELIDKIQEDSHRVYECLSGLERSDYSGSLLKDQFAEEIAKAKQILDENGNLREYHGSFIYKNWEDIIVAAEKTAFFKGSIRFLFQGSDGSIIYKDNAWDTGMFDRKFANAKLFFGKDKKDKENNKEQYKLLKFLICKCSEDDKLKLIKYDTLSASWKNNLLNKDLAATTHLFLIGNISDLNNDISLLKRNIDINKPWDRAKLDLVSTMLLENITYNGEHVDGCRLREYNNQLALFPDNAKSDMKKYVLANIRNAILSELLILKKEQFHCDQKIKNCDFFWGWDIKFQYKDNHFTYFTDDTVCLMNENWVGKKPRDNNKDNTIQNNYFFSVGKSEKADSFIEKLDCLIQQSAAVDANKNCFNECPNKEENNLQS